MNCNVHVFCKMIFSNKFGFILETVLPAELTKLGSALSNEAPLWRQNYSSFFAFETAPPLSISGSGNLDPDQSILCASEVFYYIIMFFKLSG
jgi:hypothetical protein